MLRRLVGNTGWSSTSHDAEYEAVDHLLATHRHLLLDGGRAEVGSEEGYSACNTFLSAVEKTAKALGLEVAPRAYRKKFSANYRALFPDEARHYRVDVLEASADQHSAIWVNGDKFELSPEAICHAEALQKSWMDLTSLLEGCAADGTHPARADLVCILRSMDDAWAHFEHRYIAELINIEEKARRLMIQAVENELKLEQLEEMRGSPEWKEAQASLVQCVAHLNSVANFRRKGRDDLGSDILESAQIVLDRVGITSKEVVAAGEGKGWAQATISDAISRQAGVSLAVDVVASFEAMRRYLQGVKKCLERVDPHLCNNGGLVARLVDWEESWEVGARYVRHAECQEAICDLIAACHAASHLAPAFTTMCTDCDAELFLVLPRLVILFCLAKPTAPRGGLLKGLLPHRYLESAESKLELTDDPELAALSYQFKQVIDQLGSGLGTSDAYPWTLLVRRSVIGAAEAGYQCLQHDLRDQVEKLMRGVEKQSLELQRHCAEDWNQCSSVLVQCFNGGSQKQVFLSPGGKFQV
eukprot:TRINITY_DN799_c0_g2_i1.p1 TRINITY_DN799_c0_g2~~TRINITY_DN799_c0_g2_i1.p1  ORF type:complete len:528 (+),score=100.88 TRINITY_DN799_c0_g2_i1:120-1703(+)